jgi:hypothetical protein
LVLTVRRRRDPLAQILLVTFLSSLVGATLMVAPPSADEFDTGLAQEGFLLGCFFVMGAWVALGATDLVARAGRMVALRRPRRSGAAATAALAGVLALAVLVPAVIAHWGVAHRAVEPRADRYAVSVLGELPPRSAIFIWGAERTQPLIYRQVVLHKRRDVVVVAADGLSYRWYRQQLVRRLGRPLPPRVGDSLSDAQRAIRSLEGIRPVYVDVPTGQLLTTMGYLPVGLVAEPTGGHGVARVPSATQLAARVQQAQQAAGMPSAAWRHWPNDNVLRSYDVAALEVARAYLASHDMGGFRDALLNVLRIDPANSAARRDLNLLDTSSGRAAGSGG